MLDELSSQGLELWQDERRRWRWRWLGVDLQAERGFWALGEGDAPTRSIAELARRLALLESDITAALTAQAEAELPEPAVVAEAAAAPSPFCA